MVADALLWLWSCFKKKYFVRIGNAFAILDITFIYASFHVESSITDFYFEVSESYMMRLGRVLHLSKSRNLIVRLEKNLPLSVGEKVFDNKLSELGSIQDIFGPVPAPYLSVKPVAKDFVKISGKILYSLRNE